MKLKFLFLFLSCFFIHINHAAESLPAITQEQIKIFVEEGKKLNLDWCACDAFPEKNRVQFTEQLMTMYAKNYPKKDPLVITFFASGYRFLQEYTILKSLDTLGFKHVTPLFIDPELDKKYGKLSISQFEKILKTVPSLQQRFYIPSSEEYLKRSDIPKTDILTTIDIKDPAILEYYQDILDTKMTRRGQSACTYVDLLIKIRQKREEKGLADIQAAFTTDINF